jgi:hypothetical protein
MGLRATTPNRYNRSSAITPEKPPPIVPTAVPTARPLRPPRLRNHPQNKDKWAFLRATALVRTCTAGVGPERIVE